MRIAFVLVGFVYLGHGDSVQEGTEPTTKQVSLGRHREVSDAFETFANLLLAVNAPVSRSQSGRHHALHASSRKSLGTRSASLEMAEAVKAKVSDRHLKVAEASVRNGKGHAHGKKVTDAENASFEDAQVIGQELAKVLTESSVAGEAMPDEAVTLLRKLVSSSSGARGWFVSLLTDPGFEPLFHPPIDESILQAISESPDPNIRLMTMNVAMPTATELAHLEMGNEEYAAGSRITRDRAKALVIAMLSPDRDGKERLPGLRTAFKNLLTAVQPDAESEGSGADKDWLNFCKKWGYNAAQREAIRKEVEDIVS